MGLMINGVWQEREPEISKDGHFERDETAFRNWITPDGRPGPTGQDGFRAVAGRYHLYVSLACPWAHRTLIMRALKEANGNRTRAAARIGMSRRTLHRKLHSHHLEGL